MKSKKAQIERQQRLLKFRQQALPILEKIYRVTSHGPSNAPNTMYKIIVTADKSYDYYPMSQKIRINKNDTWTWSTYDLDKLISDAENYMNNKQKMINNHNKIVNGKRV